LRKVGGKGYVKTKKVGTKKEGIMKASVLGRVRIGVCSFLALIIVVSAPLSGFAADTIKIGMVMTSSGPLEFVGRTMGAGAQFAVDEQNAKGGLLGKKVELLMRDDEFKPDVGIKRGKELILDDKINFLAGGGPSALALYSLATTYKTILINAVAPGDNFGGKDFSRYAFRVIQNMYANTAGLAHAMASKPYRRYYILNMDYTLGRDSALTFKQQLKTRLPSATIVGEDYHPPGTKDFGPYINKIIAVKADAVFTMNMGPDLTSMVKQARELGLKDLAFVTLYGGDPYTLNQLKDNAIGMYHSQGYSMRVNTPENQKMVAAYHEKHKNDKDFLTWWPYAQIGQNIVGWRMAFAAIEKAGSLDAEKIINTFEGFRYESAVGSWYMRPCDHQVILPEYVGLIQGGTNPYFNGSVRPDVKFPWEGPDLIKVPAEDAAIPATSAYNARCK
jgi:branched-chain amino acid transport system substrate-binding protein